MNQKCKFPFLYRISHNETIEQTVCALSMPPNHRECDALQRAMNWTERIPRDMNKIIIKSLHVKDKVWLSQLMTHWTFSVIMIPMICDTFVVKNILIISELFCSVD